MTREEAKHVAQLAAPRLRQSLVGDGQQADEVCSHSTAVQVVLHSQAMEFMPCRKNSSPRIQNAKWS